MFRFLSNVLYIICLSRYFIQQTPANLTYLIIADLALLSSLINKGINILFELFQ